jgi:hypothetical protein
MTNVKIFIVLISLAFAACTNKKDMSLYINGHLNDASHIGNFEIKAQKEEVLNFIVEFDKWYKEKSGNIRYNQGVGIWNIGWERNVEDEFRISFLKDSIIPRFNNCKYFTENLRNKLNTNSLKDDPGNMGKILTGSNYGRNLSKTTSMKNRDEYFYIFHSRHFLDNIESSDDPDFNQELRDISFEEAKFYHLSFIKVLNNTKVIYKVHSDITNNYIRPETFLIVEIIKENNEWLIDDMYYIEEEELIESETGFTLINYFENKEAYETGVKK